jgi:arylsulfatase A-like enzyme
MAAGGSAFAQKRAVTPPNIVLIMADDLAAWHLGCYGNREIKTPNIDTLARTGMRFANSFVCTPICSASRATFFTGRTPRQHGIHDFLTGKPEENPPQGQVAPPPSFAQEVMLSDVLAQRGYDCGYVGKWHMGDEDKPRKSFSYTYLMGGSQSYQNPVFHENGQRVEEKGYLTDLVTDRALKYLDRQSATKPFFLTVGHFNPHTPYSGHPQKYYDLYAKTNFETIGWEPAAKNALREKEMLADTVGNLRKVAASTTALDDQIPLLLNRLRQKNLLDNTLVIFTSDNGYLLGRHGLWSKGHASNPINMYEESIQIPMIFSWPGKVPAESFLPDMVSNYDLFPTVCDVADAPVPTNRNLTGRSYWPLVRREPLPKKQPWKQMVFGHFRYTEMVRDKGFKLVLRNEGQGPNEMFDLRSDPREKVNVYDNPAFVTVRDQMRRELDDWRKRSS